MSQLKKIPVSVIDILVKWSSTCIFLKNRISFYFFNKKNTATRQEILKLIKTKKSDMVFVSIFLNLKIFILTN